MQGKLSVMGDTIKCNKARKTVISTVLAKLKKYRFLVYDMEFLFIDLS